MSNQTKVSKVEELERQYNVYKARFEQWKAQNSSTTESEAYRRRVKRFQNWERGVVEAIAAFRSSVANAEKALAEADTAWMSVQTQLLAWDKVEPQLFTRDLPGLPPSVDNVPTENNNTNEEDRSTKNGEGQSVNPVQAIQGIREREDEENSVVEQQQQLVAAQKTGRQRLALMLRSDRMDTFSDSKNPSEFEQETESEDDRESEEGAPPDSKRAKMALSTDSELVRSPSTLSLSSLNSSHMLRSPCYSPSSPQYSPTSSRLSLVIPCYTPTSPQYSPTTPQLSPESLYYTPTSPQYSPTSSRLSPVSPCCIPTSPQYSPTSSRLSPVSQCYSSTSPQYSPTSTQWSPISSPHHPTSPQYSPTSAQWSPMSSPHHPTSPQYSSTSAQWSPISRCYSSTSPQYSPSSPRYEEEEEEDDEIEVPEESSSENATFDIVVPL